MRRARGQVCGQHHGKERGCKEGNVVDMLYSEKKGGNDRPAPVVNDRAGGNWNPCKLAARGVSRGPDQSRQELREEWNL